MKTENLVIMSNGTSIKFAYNTKIDLLDASVSQMLTSVIKQVNESRSAADIEILFVMNF
jgi:hypothetical protein